jgi:hypothetical protein
LEEDGRHLAQGEQRPARGDRAGPGLVGQLGVRDLLLHVTPQEKPAAILRLYADLDLLARRARRLIVQAGILLLYADEPV